MSMRYYRHRNGSTKRKGHGIADQWSMHNCQPMARIPKPALTAAQTRDFLQRKSDEAKSRLTRLSTA